MKFSFSGIKTAVNLIEKNQKKITQKFKEDMAASFQNKIIEIIISKIERTINMLKNKNIDIADISIVGGVAANKALRNSLINNDEINKYNIIYPPIEICGDNAAMIALVGLQKYKHKVKPDYLCNFKADPRLSIIESGSL
jgi:N6-L-threonylcarbamoyladenine synthase